jgi:hypothetical protein
VCRDAVTILRDDAGELDVEESKQVSVISLSGLLVNVDLISEEEIEQRGMITPGVQIRGSDHASARQEQDRRYQEAPLALQGGVWSIVIP